MKSAYIQIIGDEYPKGTTTLVDGVKTIKKTGGFEIIENPKDIKFDTTIYLVAHGDDPTVCAEVGFGGKTPNQVLETFDKIFNQTALGKKDMFKGKIILEGCHSAEPVLDKKSREKHKEMVNLKSGGGHIFKSLLGSCEAEKNSFLAEFLKIFKEKYKAKVAPEVVVGGYLGAAQEGDYGISGYGKAYSNNPLTIKFKTIKGSDEDKKTTGRVYDEKNSFLESRINQTLSFGVAGETKGVSR